MPAPAGDFGGSTPVRVKLLGPFSISMGERSTGRWERPPARRVCELLLVSPGRRLAREAMCAVLFPEVRPDAALKALSKAVFYARAALAELGPRGASLLQASRAHIWADLGARYEVDLEIHEERLRSALAAAPGLERDDRLVLALSEQGVLLEDEPFADWAVGPREHLDRMRQEARLVLGRDRAKGMGRAAPEAVAGAWEDCLSHDPTCEEAASALMRLYAAQRRHGLVESTYQRCRSALDDLGLSISPALDEVRAATSAIPRPERRPAQVLTSYPEERRLVSVVFAELSGPVTPGHHLGPEEQRELVGGALAQVVAQMEAFGGMVTSVSGAGLVALFGAPESHEDDPERALRAAFRAVTVAGLDAPGLSLRAGVETGQAVVGPIQGLAVANYSAVGEVVSAAAALQSVARPASVLVGPVTRSATEGLFEWGPLEEVATLPGAKPLQAYYLDQPRARPAGEAGRRRLAASAPLVGRKTEMSLLRDVLREGTSGHGNVLVVAGEAGLGKTRLVDECRKLFMAWVGARLGRLPLWLGGRAASYASSQPYGLYRQLLGAWVGTTPEEGDEAARRALARAMKATFGAKVDDDQVDLLAQVMGVSLSPVAARLSGLGPEQLQKARFAAVTMLLSRLVAHGPTLVALEDLHWSDPTSLRLTEAIAPLANQGPLLLVLTHRPEPDPGVSALRATLAAVPDLRFHRVELAPLTSRGERELVEALLGGTTPDDVVSAVSRGAGGNPLFLEQQLAGLLETSALTRSEQGSWRLGRAADEALPEAIERLVRSRLDRLAPGPRQAIVAASVLGPEFGLDALTTVTDLDGGLLPAVSELCSAGLLVELRSEPDPAYRFRHDLIQETTYKGLLRGQRRSLHSRAAWGLEEASAGRLEEVASLLGHHYALAGETERAVHYLELAGSRAASTFANDEAAASYRWALDLLGDAPGTAAQAARIWLELGNVDWRRGRFADGRAAFEEAAKVASAEAVVLTARALARLGAIETADHRHEAALEALEAADAQLQSCSDKDADDWVEVWLDVQLARSNLCYWRNEPEAQAAIIELLRPVVEKRGTPRQKIDFYSSLSTQRSRASRYAIDDSIMADFRAAYAAMVSAGLENELFWIGFNLGFAMLWYGDLAGAQAKLEHLLAQSRRTHEKMLELRCVTYLSCAHLRQHHVDVVKELAPQSEELALELSYPEYVGMARAMLSWAAWKEGRFADVEALTEQAMEQWHKCVVHYSWYWVGLWPLIAVLLDSGRTEHAVAAARELLGPDQQRLPEQLGSTVLSALNAWDKGDPAEAGAVLGQALEMACHLGYA